MISILSLLAYVERVWKWCDSWCRLWKSRLRQTLGPEPAHELWIYEQGEVYVPQPHLKQPQWIYNASEHTLTPGATGNTTNTKKRLPWISLHYKHMESLNTYDFSDWFSQLRMFGSAAPSILQLLRLAATVHNYPVLVDDQTCLTLAERATGETITLAGPKFDTAGSEEAQATTALPNTAQPILAPE